MSVYPPALEKLVRALSRLPGIGPKTATRLALFLVGPNRGLVGELAAALQTADQEVKTCPVCFNLTDQDICPICQDPERDQGVVCVVEGPAQVAAVERSGAFKGRYHVLGGLLAPLDKIGPAELRVAELLKRLEDPRIKEVILATSSTAQGQATATYLAGRLKGRDLRISRLAFGIPLGADLEYVDAESLKASLKGRQETD